MKNEFLDFLEEKKFIQTLEKENGRYRVVVPKVFSVTDNTNNSLRTLKKVVGFRKEKLKEIFLDFTKCEKIDLCASTILTIILINLQAEKENMSIVATLSHSLSSNSLLKYQGFLKYLSITYQNNKNENFLEYRIDNSNIKTFNMIIGGKTEKNAYKKLISDDKLSLDYSDRSLKVITDFFNECLKTKKFELTDEGERIFKGMLGEITTNLKEHLGDVFSEYCISGFYKEEEGKGVGELLFFNLGNTFYEGLKNNSTTDIKEILEQLSSAYEERVSPFNRIFTEENLWTQMALHKSISREYLKEKNNNRGTGSIRLLNFFFDISRNEENHLKNQQPRMSLISGKTKIQFDISERKYYNENEGTIIFNESDYIFDTQNSKNICSTEVFYPGAIISLNFILEREWLESSREEKSGKN
ncbi:MAG: hypothetical protein ACRC4T_01505 [Cetobacterium sp.]